MSNDNEIETIITSETQKIKNRKSKAKFFIGSILVLIAIAIGLYVGYKKLNNDPMIIYKDAINNVYKFLNNGLKEVKKNSFNTLDITREPLNVNLNAKLDSNIKELKSFTGLNYNIAAGLDYANKKINVNLGIKENNDSIVNVLLSAINKNIYLSIPEVYNKVLDLGEEDVFDNIDLELNGNKAIFNYDNYEYILKNMRSILINSLDKNKFELQEEKITLNDKDYNAKKVIYHLDSENMKRTIEFIYAEILKDEKLIQALADTLGMTTKDIKTELSEEIDMDDYEEITIVLYTDNLNSIIAGSIYVEEEQIGKFTAVGDEINIEFGDEWEQFKITYNKDNIYTLIFIEDDEEIFNVTLENNQDNLKIDYIINYEDETLTGTLEINNIKATSNKTTADFIFDINTSLLGKNMSLKFSGDIEVSKTQVTVLDYTNSIEIDDLSNEELSSIYNKLQNIMKKLGLDNIIDEIL